MPFDKLYIKVKCLICKGTKYHDKGYHNPENLTKWKRCSSCDSKGLNLIEASLKTIAKFVNNLEPNKKQILLDMIDKDNEQ